MVVGVVFGFVGVGTHSPIPVASIVGGQKQILIREALFGIEIRVGD
jgi:hypothetical protein